MAYSRAENNRKNAEVDAVLTIQSGNPEAGLERYLQSNKKARLTASKVLNLGLLAPDIAAQMKAEGNFSFAQMRVAKKYLGDSASLEKIADVEATKKLDLHYKEVIISGKPKHGEKAVIENVPKKRKKKKEKMKKRKKEEKKKKQKQKQKTKKLIKNQ